VAASNPQSGLWIAIDDVMTFASVHNLELHIDADASIGHMLLRQSQSLFYVFFTVFVVLFQNRSCRLTETGYFSTACNQVVVTVVFAHALPGWAVVVAQAPHCQRGKGGVL